MNEPVAIMSMLIWIWGGGLCQFSVCRVRQQSKSSKLAHEERLLCSHEFVKGLACPAPVRGANVA